jgi:spore germination protein GerM
MIPRNLQITGSLLLLVLIGLCIYAVQLKRRDERNRQHAAALPLASEASAQTKFQALIAYDDDGLLSQGELAAALPSENSERLRTVLRTLLHQYMQSPSSHAVPQGSDVRAVYLNPNGLCVIDINGTFADQHRSGMMIEQFTLMSLLETLAVNEPSVKQVKILVDGKERPSLAGHADLSATYDVAAVHDAVREYMHR